MGVVIATCKTYGHVSVTPEQSNNAHKECKISDDEAINYVISELRYSIKMDTRQ